MSVQNRDSCSKRTMQPTCAQRGGAVPPRKSGCHFQKKGFWAGKTTHVHHTWEIVWPTLGNKNNALEKTQKGLSQHQRLLWNELGCQRLSACCTLLFPPQEFPVLPSVFPHSFLPGLGRLWCPRVGWVSILEAWCALG